MKVKIKEALKTKYSNLGLGDELLQSYAEGLAATGLVTDENLATVIQGQEQALKEFQRGYDKLRTESSSYKSQLEELQKKIEPNSQPNPNPQPAPKGGDNPTDIAKIIAEAVAAAVNPLNEKIQAMQTNTLLKTRQQKFEEATKGLDETYLTALKQSFDLVADKVDDATFDQFIQTTQSSAKEIIAINNSVVPSRGVFAKGTLSDAEAEKIAERIK